MPSSDELFARILGRLRGWLRDLVDLLPNLLLALLVVVAFGLLARVVERTVRGLVGRVSDQEAIARLLGRIARMATVGAGFFFALGLLHLDKTVTSLLAGVGVLGLALGFAFQDIAANFVSGLIMVFRQPFAIGDLVELGGEIGHVDRIELRATQLTTFHGLTVTLPNKDVFQSKIINYTQTSIRRVDIEVGVAYSDDLRRVREVATAALEGHSGRSEARPVAVNFVGFGESSIDLLAAFWIETADQASFLAARSEAIMLIKEAFDAAGITIPFPIRTLDFGADGVGGVALHQQPVAVANQQAGS